MDVSSNAYYLKSLYTHPNSTSEYLDTRKQTTGLGIDISSYSPNQRYTPQYEHVRVKGRIINQNDPQYPYYVLEYIKQEKIK
ncbi:hypothetical protein BH11PAT1_BH11PAT1_6330 [soil metagenome]